MISERNIGLFQTTLHPKGAKLRGLWKPLFFLHGMNYVYHGVVNHFTELLVSIILLAYLSESRVVSILSFDLLINLLLDTRFF